MTTTISAAAWPRASAKRRPREVAQVMRRVASTGYRARPVQPLRASCTAARRADDGTRSHASHDDAGRSASKRADDEPMATGAWTKSAPACWKRPPIRSAIPWALRWRTLAGARSATRDTREGAYRAAPRGPMKGYRGRCLRRLRKLHAGAQRHLHEVQHLRLHERLQLRRSHGMRIAGAALSRQRSIGLRSALDVRRSLPALAHRQRCELPP